MIVQTPVEILFDEPTNHLAIHHQIEILSLVKKTAAPIASGAAEAVLN